MNDSLFANVEGKLKENKQESFYDQVLEKRKRPDLPLEEGEISISKKELEKLQVEKRIHELKKYEPETVREKATQYFNGDELAANVWINK
ncbi:MAG: hypothetical protein K8S16_07565, partial [Bacteroidales bacterium]|nr:hypothetical protein [Bacteroidales bacterium]